MIASIKYTSGFLLGILFFACKSNVSKSVVSEAASQQTAVIDTIIVDAVINIQEEPVADTTLEEILVFETSDDPPAEMLPPLPVVRSSDKPKEQRYHTPMVYMGIEFTDTTTKNGIYTFYYSPRMKDKEYSYQQHLRSDNNFVGWTSRYGKDVIAIPDTLESGAQLLFRSIGCEPYSIYVDSLKQGDYTPIELKPKTYTAIAVLREVNGKIYADVINEVARDTAFFGECNPIYDDDGGHADPVCAFSCLGECYPYLYYTEIRAALKENRQDAEVLYKALKKGKPCSILLTADRRGVIAEIEKQPRKKSNNFLEALTEVKWDVRSNDGSFFKHRIIFVAKERLEDMLTVFHKENKQFK